MNPLPGEEGYTASVALGDELLVVGSPGEPVSGDFEETPRIFLIEAEAWMIDPGKLWVGYRQHYRVRLGATWFILRGRITNCGTTPAGEMATLEITGEVEGLGRVVIDVR